MLERLKLQREEYAVEVERLRNVDLNEIVNAKFEEVRACIEEEVKAEHEAKIAAAELNVDRYDFVISIEEAKAIAEAEAEISENISDDETNEETSDVIENMEV